MGLQADVVSVLTSQKRTKDDHDLYVMKNTYKIYDFERLLNLNSFRTRLSISAVLFIERFVVELKMKFVHENKYNWLYNIFCLYSSLKI